VPVWLTGLGQFNGAYLTRILPLLPLALLQGIVLTLGEEIGWRGLLVPALYRAGGFGWAGLASGLIWGLWHVPLIVVGGYDAGTPVWFGVPCFMVSVTAMGAMLAWVRLRSGSVWPSVAFHAVHNLAIQGVFDGSTIDTGPTKWLTTEFGIGLTVLTVVIGAYFWRRRSELPADLAPLPPRAGEGAGG
jgi:membrane protease YdiL (CAAX protease family)